jgi:hypothetical protein
MEEWYLNPNSLILKAYLEVDDAAAAADDDDDNFAFSSVWV